ncbi:MAG TPA: DUF4350 domain-containing protein, partial [Anaeromyxobacteraceae bacterium]|nr:DUF4350 domain-containing protein [Anaeromyxobacteraceae bacterium]
MSEGPFSSRGARRLAAVAVVSLAASGLLAAFGDAFQDLPSFGADGYSRSAIGHHAFLRLLRELGYPVIASRHRTAAKATEGTVLVLAEPQIGALEQRAEAVKGMWEQADRMLVVLPKRFGAPRNDRPRWLGAVEMLPVSEAQRVLEALSIEAEVVRPKRSVADWKGELPAPSVEQPQLVVSGELDPLVSTAEGMLAGEMAGEGWHLVVLADPDVIATHGLGQGANAELAVRLVERLAGEGATLLVDETQHGWEASPSLFRELVRWPLVLATLQAALALGLVAWAALVRFGRARRPRPDLAPGTAVLIDNTAALLRHGRHLAPALAAYWRSAKEQIASALRAPGERGEARDAWLARVAGARGHAARLEALERRVAAMAGRPRAGDEAVRIALEVH